MKEKHILFSAPMVKAILGKNKTQTRRIVKHKYSLIGAPRSFEAYDCEDGYGFESDDEFVRCPFPKPGGKLWVRETWAYVNTPDGPAICYRADGNYKHWRDFSTVFDKDYGAGPSMNYEAYLGDYCMWWEDLLNGKPDHKWRSPIHMFRWASRIDLEVVRVRVERVQDISADDARAEGLSVLSRDGGKTWKFGIPDKDGLPGNDDIGWPWREWEQDPRMAFKTLWDKINGKKYPWESNPLVWVLEFKPCT